MVLGISQFVIHDSYALVSGKSQRSVDLAAPLDRSDLAIALLIRWRPSRYRLRLATINWVCDSRLVTAPREADVPPRREGSGSLGLMRYFPEHRRIERISFAFACVLNRVSSTSAFLTFVFRSCRKAGMHSAPRHQHGGHQAPRRGMSC